MSELLKLVNEQAEDEGLWFNAETAPEAYLQAALGKLHAAVENTHPDNWISVDERLPEEKTNVLTWGGHTEPAPAYCNSSGAWYDYDWGNFKFATIDKLEGIKFWQPLPTPPTGEG